MPAKLRLVPEIFDWFGAKALMRDSGRPSFEETDRDHLARRLSTALSVGPGVLSQSQDVAYFFSPLVELDYR